MRVIDRLCLKHRFTRRPQNDRLAAGVGLSSQPQASRTNDARDGPVGNRTGTPYQSAVSETPCVSVWAAGSDGRATHPGLVCGYHLCADASEDFRTWWQCSIGSAAMPFTMEAAFCVDALERVLTRAHPEIFNTDQGTQFTVTEFTGRLERAGGSARMVRPCDGQRDSRAAIAHSDVRRPVFSKLCRRDAVSDLDRFFRFYSTECPHQGLGKQTPAAVHFA